MSSFEISGLQQGLNSEARNTRRDRRAENEESTNKQQRIENGEIDANKLSILPKPFSQEEINAEERRPKHKVAVLIGYAGTGYKGMQMSVPLHDSHVSTVSPHDLLQVRRLTRKP